MTPEIERALNTAIALEKWFIRYPAFIWFASLLHIFWGVILISSDRELHCVPLDGLYSAIADPFALGIVLILVGLVALWSAPKGTDKLTFKIITLLPQQYFTLLSGGSALRAIEAGHYADGVVRP